MLDVGKAGVAVVRILIVAPEQIPVPPVLGGSVEICILAIARKLAERHEVTIISRRHHRYPHRTEEGSLTIIRVPTGSPGRYLGEVLKLLKKSNLAPFDLIQVDNRPRFVEPLKQLFPGTPVSLFLHSLTFVSKPFISRDTAAACLARADLIVANSSSLQSKLAERFPGAAAKICKVWLGVDTTRFAPAKTARNNAVRRKAGWKKAFTVLYAGRLVPSKGIPVLMRAVRLAQAGTKRPIRLMIAGGAQRKAYRATLRQTAKKLRLHAKFLGSVPHRRIHRIYRLADCFVCPSQRHEAFGLVNVEAMAAGVPVIAANNGGIKEIITDGENGLLVQAYRSPKPYASAILKLMKSARLARSLARRGRQTAVERFGWDITAGEIEQIYGRIVAEKKRWLT